MIDVHCHILPGIDDGSRNIEESIQMIREANQAGFHTIFATSHYIEESYATPKQKRQEWIEFLNHKIEEENLTIKICNGAEVYITLNLLDLIQKGEIPTLNNTKYVLIELPMNSQIIYLEKIVEDLMSSGLIPIIAHPERYSYVQENPKTLKRWKEKGVLFQANYGSVIGAYGKEAEKTLKKLFKNDMIDLMGSDCHRQDSIYPKMSEALKKLTKWVGREKLEELTTINPQKLL